MNLLEKLIGSYGVSGNESDVRKVIHKEIKKHVDETWIDGSGNLIAHNKGKPPRVMLAAHMDEIGLVIKHINDSGKIYFAPVGGIEPLNLIGQRVIIKAKADLLGAITTSHMMDGYAIKDMPKLDDMFIDCGLNKKELERKGVSIGTFIAFEQTTEYVGNGGLITGKSLDDRIGCYILAELAKKAKTRNDIFFTFTVQEEMGLYGAKTSAYNIQPDWAVVVDTTPTYEVDNAKKIGNGPCVIVKDVGMIGNIFLNEWLEEVAKKKNIPIQLDVSDFGTSDALSISLSRGGIPTTAVNVPVGNIHSTIGIASMKDIKNAILILHELLKNPPQISAK